MMWGMNGATQAPSLTQWDPKQESFVEALLEVLASGATIVLRPGSGGRSIGVAIWEGDTRHAPQWCYEAEELDNWSQGIILLAAQLKRSQDD